MPAVLPVVAVALAVCLLAFAAYILLQRPMEAIFSAIPGFQSWYANAASNATLAVLRGAQGLISDGIRPLAALFRQAHGVLLGRSDSTTAALEMLHNAVFNVRMYYLPQAEARAEHYAAVLVQVLQVWTANALSGLRQYAQLLHVQALQYAQQLQRQALAYAQALAAQAERYAQVLSQRDQRYSQELATQGLQYAQAVGLAAEDYAAGLDRRAEEYTRQAAGSVYDALLQGLREQEAYTGRVGQAAEEYARATAEQVVSYAQALAVPLAAAITAVEESACMRQCNTLGNLGAELSGLDLGFLFLLLASAATEAPALAKAFTEDVEPELEAMAGSIRGLIGV
jgi:hypothetical protein